jgi:prepilin-type N-terminal cleavage/methylation domain-containing protein
MKTAGYSLLEVLMVITVLVIIAGAAIPLAHGGVDRARAAAAARHMAGRMMTARFEAVRRSAFVAIRFEENAGEYVLRTFVDGNGDGVLSRDIARSIDWPVTNNERLQDHFPGVSFGIQRDVTSLDAGQPLDATDPIQIGSSTLVSFSPDGSSTSGTVFIRGRETSQFAVRLLGLTGRTRVFEFNFADGSWQTR